jgi:hypothetical protein
VRGQAVSHAQRRRANGPCDKACRFHLPELLTQNLCRHAGHGPTQLAKAQGTRFAQSPANHRFPFPLDYLDRRVDRASIALSVTRTSCSHDVRRVLQSAYLPSSTALSMLSAREGLWPQRDCFA